MIKASGTRIYWASCLQHTNVAKAFRLDAQARGMEITSRWIDKADEANEALDDVMRETWLADEQDILAADRVLLFALPDDFLRGALVEAGMGIAYGKIIWCVGQNRGFGSWVKHPQVVHWRTLDQLWYALDLVGFPKGWSCPC